MQIKAGLRADDIAKGVRLDPSDYVRLVSIALRAAEAPKLKGLEQDYCNLGLPVSSA